MYRRVLRVLVSFGILDPDSSRFGPSLLVPCMHSFIACKVIDGFPNVVCRLLMVLGPTYPFNIVLWLAFDGQ